MAVDDSEETFWASRFDDTSDAVEFVIDFGDMHTLASLEIFWEFPAKAFSVSVSSDGEHYSEVYATEVNVLQSSKVALASASARKLRISMREAASAQLLIFLNMRGSRLLVA